ncbi:MAG TPA: VWA domain-containing protein [Terriglobia bacterium]|nr:VWA domain-containing protein [Terriglobia bacterium]
MKFLLPIFLFFQFTISVDVDLVTFNVTALDNNGDTVSGLTAGNFRIFEDGREQTIKVFQPEDTPATVGIVIDNSGSMAKRRADVVTSAMAFVGASHPDDEMFIVNFNRHPWLALPESMAFTSNREQLRSALLTTTAEGTTALYDALELSLTHLNLGTRQRKALVLLSDGGDNASYDTLDDVLRLAQHSSATIYCIGIYDPQQNDKNPKVLRQIAKLTGGEAFFPQRAANLKQIWPRIAGALRGQYTIGYLSTTTLRNGAYRAVKITAVDSRGKSLDVRARPGYLAPSGPPESK